MRRLFRKYMTLFKNRKHPLLSISIDSVDSLLQIHALFNLLEASKLAPGKEQLTEHKQSTYCEKLNTLQSKYLGDKSAVLQSAANAYESKLKELNKLKDQSESNILELFATLIQTDDSWHSTIYNKISDEFFAQNVPLEKRPDTTSMTGFLYVINNWHKRLMKLYNNLCKEFEYLNTILLQACGEAEKGRSLTSETINFIKNVSDCHLSDILVRNTYIYCAVSDYIYLFFYLTDR